MSTRANENIPPDAYSASAVNTHPPIELGSISDIKRRTKPADINISVQIDVVSEDDEPGARCIDKTSGPDSAVLSES